MEDAEPVVAAPAGYVLGHSDAELRRLALQSVLIDPITRRLLQDGGISTGMRVLDVGSGAGHVSFLVAELVGPSGAVVGADRSPAAVEAATVEAAARGLSQVSFVVGDPAEMAFDPLFDAVVGRFVLQFQADPAAMLRSVAGHVRPGGAVVFQELAWTGPWSFPPVPAHEQVCAAALKTLELSGADTAMGLKLHTTFVRAGLGEPTLRAETIMGGGAKSALLLEHVAALTATLLPAMQELGVATAVEVGLETLLARMQAETLANDSVILGRLQIGGWATVPAG
jgi:SAM-dependent methyltransferase